MTIHKIGHSCFVVRGRDSQIATDPGVYTDGQRKLTGLSAILITHRHKDHMDVDSLKVMLDKNPDAEVISNSEVKELLVKENIEVRAVLNEERFSVGEFEIQGFETDHAFIHTSIEVPRNTGFLFDVKFYMPGDALFAPPTAPKALGIPFGAPWATIGELLDYGARVKPEKCFPTHDGMLKILGLFEGVPKEVLAPLGIEYIPMRAGDEIEL